ncbi:non-SMC element 4 homolog A (S. cerevisiae) [Nesidiocoris tenuis]|uniref:Non-structural maintenance of chromosomes element 4 n=1 Tax=Nesidiocoris tenuis TaxID=355587 RepID=A0ABN7BG03_9HEMI|nr:non-SMC element 4 homolog A (S. cerevisiae) [Nesidiocoris tenuis]
MEEQVEEPILSDTLKKRVLNEVKESMKPAALTNDNKLAEQLKRVVASVNNLGRSSSTLGDLNFTVNVLNYAVDCATTHLENSGPARELFQESCIADGVTMLSWCPGGYDQLVQMTKAAVPFRPSFQKCITLQDLEERHSASGLNPPTREKKPRRQRAALVRGPATAPKKITTVEETQAQKVNMQTAYEVIRQRCRNGPIPFYRFVINPKSFVQTCYNIFIVSFLVHEQHAYLSIGDGHELLIGPKLSGSDDGSIEKIQVVQSLSALEWDQLVTKLNITESMLPDFCPKQSQYFQDGQIAHELATGVVFLEP